MATTQLAGLIPASKLVTALDKAVKVAAARHGLAVGDKNVMVNWELVGRRVTDLEVGRKFAADVSKDLKAQGFKVEAGTLIVGKQILCGFYEKARIPQLRDIG